ncbi:MAG: transposase [Patescibacteria group bacterium]
MPSRNLEKIYLPEAYYHLYNRGVNKRRVFLDDSDYAVFLNLLKRYLDDKPTLDNRGREYEWLHNSVELLSFCLMPNHYHLLIYQLEPDAMTQLLRRVGTSYTAYFNKKYKRTGPLFQDRFKASMITRDDYLQHISRYIHLNPQQYQKWKYSSLPYYLDQKQANWIQPERILELFSSVKEYEKFVADWIDQKKIIDEIKNELADY